MANVASSSIATTGLAVNTPTPVLARGVARGRVRAVAATHGLPGPIAEAIGTTASAVATEAPKAAMARNAVVAKEVPSGVIEGVVAAVPITPMHVAVMLREVTRIALRLLGLACASQANARMGHGIAGSLPRQTARPLLDA